MAVSGRKKPRGGWFLFWIAFLIGISLLFMVNIEKIKNTLNGTKLLERLRNSEEKPGEDLMAGQDELEDRILELASAMESEGPLAGSVSTDITRETEQAVSEASSSQTASASQTASQTASISQTAPVSQAPAIKTTENPASQPETGSVGQEKTVSRLVYLIKIDNAGTILWTSVKRDLPASDSPLFDTLEALIKGPSMAEEKQGLISLIPKNVKIQNAVVRGNTAYISFSEDFLFNTYGVEGYASQRKQIILTVTEFSNVKDVQILIEGKRVDYLGEGIWIGGPVSRSML